MSLSSRLIFALLLLPSLAFSGTLKGVGGIDSEPPDWTEFSNKAPDPSFEAGVDWNIGSGCERSTEQAQDGSYSLKCTAPAGDTYKSVVGGVGYQARKYAIKIYPGADASGHVIYNSTNTTRGGTAFGGVKACAEPDTAENCTAWKGEYTIPLQQWTEVTFTDPAYSAPGMADDNIQPRIKTNTATGTWYFDVVELTPTVPLVRSFIKYPNFRGYLWSDWSQVVTGVVEVNAPEGEIASDYKVVIDVYKVVDSGANTLEDTITLETLDSSLVAEAQVDFSFDAAAYTTDDELLFSTELQLKVDDSVVDTFPDWRVVLKDNVVRDALQFYFDTDNKLVKDGERRFMWGAYERPSGVRCQGCVWTDKNRYLNDLLGFDAMGEVQSQQFTHANTSIYFSPMSGANPGYNSTTSEWDNPSTYDIALDSLNPWIEALEDYGSSHLHITNWMYENKTWPPWLAGLTEKQVWQMYATYPKSDGFFGWYAADEPDLYNGEGWTSETMAWKQRTALKEHDSLHPTFGVMYNSWTALKWRELVDIIGSDPYPLGRTTRPGDWLYGDTTAPFYFQVNQWTDYVDASSHNARPHLAVLQQFRYSSTYPTYNELRLMAWKAIISGADGILWWGWVSSVGLEDEYYDLNHTETWDDYVRISDEIMGIEDALVGVDVTSEVTCSSSDIDFRALSDGVDTYIMASSTIEAAQTGVQFTYSSMGGSVEVYTEGRSISPEGSSFTDDFALNYDVHVYKINSTSVNFTEPGITNFTEATGDVYFNQ